MNSPLSTLLINAIAKARGDDRLLIEPEIPVRSEQQSIFDVSPAGNSDLVSSAERAISRLEDLLKELDAHGIPGAFDEMTVQVMAIRDRYQHAVDTGVGLNDLPTEDAFAEFMVAFHDRMSRLVSFYRGSEADSQASSEQWVRKAASELEEAQATAPDEDAAETEEETETVVDQPVNSTRSKQFVSYASWIAEGNELSKGLLEQIRFDERLEDGESAVLEAMFKEAEAAHSETKSLAHDEPGETDQSQYNPPTIANIGYSQQQHDSVFEAQLQTMVETGTTVREAAAARAAFTVFRSGQVSDDLAQVLSNLEMRMPAISLAKRLAHKDGANVTPKELLQAQVTLLGIKPDATPTLTKTTQPAPSSGDVNAGERQPFITPDDAAKMKRNDVVVDAEGREYLALGARHKWLEVAPIVDGKPQVNNVDVFRFHLEPESADAYPERRSDPIYFSRPDFYSTQNADLSQPAASPSTPPTKEQNLKHVLGVGSEIGTIKLRDGKTVTSARISEKITSSLYNVRGQYGSQIFVMPMSADILIECIVRGQPGSQLAKSLSQKTPPISANADDQTSDMFSGADEKPQAIVSGGDSVADEATGSDPTRNDSPFSGFSSRSEINTFWTHRHDSIVLSPQQKLLTERILEAQLDNVSSYRGALEYINSQYPGFLPLDTTFDDGASLSESEIAGAWHYLKVKRQAALEAAAEARLKKVLGVGSKIGDIMPSDRKLLRATLITGKAGNGAYEMVGTRGPKKYSATMSADSLIDSIVRGQPDSRLAQTLAGYKSDPSPKVELTPSIEPQSVNEPLEAEEPASSQNVIPTLNVVADSWESLRAIDVNRLIHTAFQIGEDHLEAVIKELRGERPDLEEAFQDAFEDAAVFLEKGENSFLKELAVPVMRKLRGDDIKDAIKQKNPDIIGTELAHKGGKRFAFILPDASEPGKIRVSYFDENGFSGHDTYTTPEDALNAAVGSGYTDDATGRLDELSQLDSFIKGNERADRIRKVNNGEMTWEEHIALSEAEAAQPEDSGSTGKSTTPPADYVEWDSASPGDYLGSDRYLIARKIKTKRAAEALAAEKNGRIVVIDGAKHWGVLTVGPNEFTAKPDATNKSREPDTSISEIHKPKDRDEIHSLEKYAVYIAGQHYAIRGDGNYGMGDLLFNTPEEALANAKSERERDEANAKSRAESQAKAEEEKAESEAAERILIESYGAFLSDTPMRRQRQRDALEKKVNNKGRIITLKDLIEGLVKEGYQVTESEIEDSAAKSRAQADYDRLRKTAPWGNEQHPETKRMLALRDKLDSNGFTKAARYLEKGNSAYDISAITKTGMDYAEYLLAQSQPVLDNAAHDGAEQQSEIAAPDAPGGMSIAFMGRTEPVASFAEASHKWLDVVDEVARQGVGSRGLDADPIILNAAGEQIARISYNGRVWGLDGEEISLSAADKTTADSEAVERASTKVDSDTVPTPENVGRLIREKYNKTSKEKSHNGWSALSVELPDGRSFSGVAQSGKVPSAQEQLAGRLSAINLLVLKHQKPLADLPPALVIEHYRVTQKSRLEKTGTSPARAEMLDIFRSLDIPVPGETPQEEVTVTSGMPVDRPIDEDQARLLVQAYLAEKLAENPSAKVDSILPAMAGGHTFQTGAPLVSKGAVSVDGRFEFSIREILAALPPKSIFAENGISEFQYHAGEEHGPVFPDDRARVAVSKLPHGGMTVLTIVRPSGSRHRQALMSVGEGRHVKAALGSEYPTDLDQLKSEMLASHEKTEELRLRQQAHQNAVDDEEKRISETRKFRVGTQLGDITPSSGKTLKSALITQDHGNGTFTVEGKVSNRSVAISIISASSLVKAQQNAEQLNDAHPADLFAQQTETDDPALLNSGTPVPDTGTQEVSGRQARPGGEYGLNGEWYQGGQFMPASAFTVKGQHKSTASTGTGRVLVAPGEYAQPEEGKAAIFGLIREFVEPADGALVRNFRSDDVLQNFGLTPEQLTKYIDLYNQGVRFYSKDPDDASVTPVVVKKETAEASAYEGDTDTAPDPKQMQKDDIGTKGGKPFKTDAAARRADSKANGKYTTENYTLVDVEGGVVFRSQATIDRLKAIKTEIEAPVSESDEFYDKLIKKYLAKAGIRNGDVAMLQREDVDFLFVFTPIKHREGLANYLSNHSASKVEAAMQWAVNDAGGKTDFASATYHGRSFEDVMQSLSRSQPATEPSTQQSESPTEAFKSRILKDLGNDLGGLQLMIGQESEFILFVPAPDGEGVRISYFSDTGFSRSGQFDSYSEAIEFATSAGYLTEAPGALASKCSLPGFVNGYAVATLIQRLHDDTIEFDDYLLELAELAAPASTPAAHSDKLQETTRIIQSTHTKKGHDVYIVQLDEKLSRDQYKAIEAMARSLSGYYSRYKEDGAIPGFHFKDIDKANEFVNKVEQEGIKVTDSARQDQAINKAQGGTPETTAENVADRPEYLDTDLEELLSGQFGTYLAPEDITKQKESSGNYADKYPQTARLVNSLLNKAYTTETLIDYEGSVFVDAQRTYSTDLGRRIAPIRAELPNPIPNCLVADDDRTLVLKIGGRGYKSEYGFVTASESVYLKATPAQLEEIDLASLRASNDVQIPSPRVHQEQEIALTLLSEAEAIADAGIRVERNGILTRQGLNLNAGVNANGDNNVEEVARCLFGAMLKTRRGLSPTMSKVLKAKSDWFENLTGHPKITHGSDTEIATLWDQIVGKESTSLSTRHKRAKLSQYTIVEIEQTIAGEIQLDTGNKSEPKSNDNQVGSFELTPPDAQKTNHSSRTTKLKDSGEELAANKRTVLTAEYLSTVDTTERVRLTEKKNIWPKPNYEALVDAKHNPIAVFVLKQIYDAIAVRPSDKSDQGLETYYNTVKKLKTAAEEHIFSDKYSVAIAESAQIIIDSMKSANDYLLSMDTHRKVTDNMGYVSDAILNDVFPKNERGQRWGSSNRDGNDSVLAVGGNRFSKRMKIGYPELKKAVKLISEGWPQKQEAWQKTYEIIHQDDTILLRRKRGKGVIEKVAVADYASVEAAMDVAKELARDKSKSKRQKSFSEPSVSLDQVIRSGPARRSGDVSSDELRETFGFKGINFGNWMNAEDRRLHCNFAYDAFYDLAELFNLPPKAMSLDGLLGIAFGAQGSGKYAAHFIPGINNINITKTKGAGSVAHEWGHALDHYYGVLAGYDRSTTPFLSHHPLGGRSAYNDDSESAIRTEITDRFNKIHSLIQQKTRILSTEEVEEQRKGWIATHTKRVEKSLAFWRGLLKSEEDTKTFDACAERLRNGQRGDLVKMQRSKHEISEYVRDIRELVKKSGYKCSPDECIRVDNSAHYIALYSDAETYHAESGKETETSATDFARGAAKLDSGKKDPYFSTKVELFARAFESFVLDALAERDIRNDYLTSAWKGSTTGPAYLVNYTKKAYPQDEERKAINEAFASLTSEIKHKATDNGIALYSLNDAPDMPTQTAYHGTPFTFDNFSLSRVGSGEGFQAYGWGLYFSSTEEVAKFYQRATEADRLNNLDDDDIATAFFNTVCDEQEVAIVGPIQTKYNRGQFVSAWKSGEINPFDFSPRVRTAVENSFKGNTYSAAIPSEEQLLDWDKPLSEQSEYVRTSLGLNDTATEFLQWYNTSVVEKIGEEFSWDKLRKNQKIRQIAAYEKQTGRKAPLSMTIISPEKITGQQFYEELAYGDQLEEGAQAASLYLSQHGIPGLRYLDDYSRLQSSPNGTYNMVIWDESRITMAHVDDQVFQAKLQERLMYDTRKGVSVSALSKALAPLLRATNATVSLIQSESELPAIQRRQVMEKNYNGRVAGLYDKTTGTSFIIADNLESLEHGAKTFLHEVMGHRRIRIATGNALNTILLEIYRDMPDSDRAMIELEYKNKLSQLSSSTDKHLLIADEYVAKLSENQTSHHWVKRIILAIMNWMCEICPFIKSRWSPANIYRLLDSASDVEFPVVDGSDCQFALAPEMQTYEKIVICDTDIQHHINHNRSESIELFMRKYSLSAEEATHYAKLVARETELRIDNSNKQSNNYIVTANAAAELSSSLPQECPAELIQTQHQNSVSVPWGCGRIIVSLKDGDNGVYAVFEHTGDSNETIVRATHRYSQPPTSSQFASDIESFLSAQRTDISIWNASAPGSRRPDTILHSRSDIAKHVRASIRDAVNRSYIPPVRFSLRSESRQLRLEILALPDSFNLYKHDYAVTDKASKHSHSPKDIFTTDGLSLLSYLKAELNAYNSVGDNNGYEVSISILPNVREYFIKKAATEPPPSMIGSAAVLGFSYSDDGLQRAGIILGDANVIKLSCDSHHRLVHLPASIPKQSRMSYVGDAISMVVANKRQEARNASSPNPNATTSFFN